MRSAVTQHTFPAISSRQAPQLVANISVKPPDAPANAQMKAAELLYAPSVTSGASPLLYASNRDENNAQGDALAVFETTPSLKLVKHVRTGLRHLRGVAFLGENKEWIIAGGMNGGGIKIFKRVPAEDGYLTQVAALNITQIGQPATFVWVQG
jgi:6-phosphogluconolactonase (cycloisomerase 2 family)